VWKCPARSRSTPQRANTSIASRAETDERDVAQVVGQVERVMGDDDLVTRSGDRIEQAMDRRHLLVVERPFLNVSERAVLMPMTAISSSTNDGSQIAAEVALELAERAQKALPDAVERHVVVARDDDHRRRDTGEKSRAAANSAARRAA